MVSRVTSCHTSALVPRKPSHSPGHEVILIDANARTMTDDELVKFVQDEGVELVGIGAMTRMA